MNIATYDASIAVGVPSVNLDDLRYHLGEYKHPDPKVHQMFGDAIQLLANYIKDQHSEYFLNCLQYDLEIQPIYLCTPELGRMTVKFDTLYEDGHIGQLSGTFRGEYGDGTFTAATLDLSMKVAFPASYIGMGVRTSELLLEALTGKYWESDYDSLVLDVDDLDDMPEILRYMENLKKFFIKDHPLIKALALADAGYESMDDAIHRYDEDPEKFEEFFEGYKMINPDVSLETLVESMKSERDRLKGVVDRTITVFAENVSFENYDDALKTVKVKRDRDDLEFLEGLL